MKALSFDPIIAILRHRGRPDLAGLLARSTFDFDESSTYGSHLYSTLTTVVISSPIEDYDRLKAMSEKDSAAILSAFIELHPPRAHDIEITHIEFQLDPASLLERPDASEELIRQIEDQRRLMEDIATGGPRIPEVEKQYLARRSLIHQELLARGLKDPNPFNSLWDWYNKYKADIPGYQPRREFLSQMYSPLIEKIRSGDGSSARVFERATGWPAVDIGVEDVRALMQNAATERQFQTVGLNCRELTITLAQIVFDPALHPTIDGVKASPTDAKRMLEAYIAVELRGSSNDELRKHARAAFDLANALQHRRTATFRNAALCAEATTSIINLIAIVSGRRDP